MECKHQIREYGVQQTDIPCLQDVIKEKPILIMAWAFCMSFLDPLDFGVREAVKYRIIGVAAVYGTIQHRNDG